MDLADLVAFQKNFDAQHGWDAQPQSTAEALTLLERDLVGLIGEIGEFANVLKKIRLLERFPERMEREWHDRRPELSEEVVDTLIYLVRIAGHLTLDLERSYTEKMQRNASKFHDFKRV
jgi:NTP pyrophosphatase (non-canonical NTP hydrolase)